MKVAWVNDCVSVLILYGLYYIRAASAQMHPPGQPIVVFRPDKARSNEQDETFTGNLNVYDELNSWVTEKCVPLVREITFENAEELTEEGIPFLILFHKPEDNESVKKFNDVVRNELISEKSKFPIHLQYCHLTLTSPPPFCIGSLETEPLDIRVIPEVFLSSFLPCSSFSMMYFIICLFLMLSRKCFHSISESLTVTI